MSDPASPAYSWLKFVREVIEAAVRGADPARLIPPPEESREFGGVFVTLRRFGRLRGCMGTLNARQPLAEAIRDAATTAALQDPRFPPVSIPELPEIVIELSVLSQPRPMRNLDELEVGRHGVLVRRGARQGLFLPQVATEHHLGKQTFLSRCCSEKAGLPPDAWRDPATEVLLFTAQIHHEQAP